MNQNRAPFATTDVSFPRDTRHSLPIALLRAREQVMSRFRPMLAAHDINEQQWRVLRVLNECGALDATDLAVRANILSPSLTRMIKAMTERGLIRRSKDDNDGRRVILEIAQAGAELITSVGPEAQVIYSTLAETFGADRLSALLDLLDQLTDALQPRD
ncbi:MAG: homoprotocatechuate degradation operon regulator HpaR [Rhodobacteraceae bacterium]|nr:homoprotocatechuate degradation operon regulator HpaR [Paracoccaceae bacterium]